MSRLCGREKTRRPPERTAWGKNLFRGDHIVVHRLSAGQQIDFRLGTGGGEDILHPLGLLLGASKTAHSLIYPVFEIMRPVPPLAWVPVAVIFWPTPEMSMVFVTFLGAFFIVVINIVDGVRSIDARYLRAARSLGSSRSDMFWHILLPGSLPSIVVGMTVGMGVTWAVVVAAEMIASRTGLGYLTWSAYVAGEFPVIIIGMMSIGIAGYVCSAIIRFAGTRMTPWLRTF